GTAPISRRPQSTTGMFDPVQRLKDMDLEGIDTAVNFGTTVFLSLPFLENHDLACAIAHAYNTWLAGYCQTDSRRLKGVALVAMQEPVEAVKELARCVKEFGFVAVAVAAHSAGRNLDHPDFYPFYAKAEELGVPVCVHVGSGRPSGGSRPVRQSVFRARNHACVRTDDRRHVHRRWRYPRAFPEIESRFFRSGRRLGAVLDG